MYELNPPEETQRDAVRASVEFAAYLRDARARAARRRRRRPHHALAHVVDEGERLTEDELVGTCVLLLNAGHEATVNATAARLVGAVPQSRPSWRELRADPALLPTAVEELLRYDTPAADVRTLGAGGHPSCTACAIPQGAELGLLFGSANRDPTVFDAPDELRLGRDAEPAPHASAPGSTSASGRRSAGSSCRPRSGTLLNRFPDMALAEEPTFRPNYIIRGLEGLRVTV